MRGKIKGLWNRLVLAEGGTGSAACIIYDPGSRFPKPPASPRTPSSKHAESLSL